MICPDLLATIPRARQSAIARGLWHDGRISTRDVQIHGVNAQLAIDAIKARAARRSAADGRKLALVIEGGALRGVCSGGGIVALDLLGFRDVFDEVYGTSAGAMNASYFLAGQTKMGISIYYDDMNRREIVNPLRFWRIVDLDRLFRRTLMGTKRLRLDAVLSARSKLYIAALDKSTGGSALFDAKSLGGEEGLLTALRAATAVPLLYNRAVDVGGRLCMDAGIVNAFPLEDAIAAGCTDILVLLTRPCGYRRRTPGAATRWLFKRHCARGNPRLMAAFDRYVERDTAVRDLAFGRVAPPRQVNIATICTDDVEIVQRMTTDASVLHAGATAFGRKTLRAFGADPEALLLTPPTERKREKTPQGQIDPGAVDAGTG
jgi:predicted patatin/cPLA2 family phospholipase